MPRKTSRSEPPEVMTRTSVNALISLAFAVIFDALRFFFEWFIFFGPAAAGLLCTVKASDAIGTAAAGTICGAGAGIAGIFGAEITGPLGIIMAEATGLAGWLVIGGWLAVTNLRIFKDNALWFGGSLLLSEIPFVGGIIPAFTAVIWKMYGTQIKVEKAAYKKWEKENAAAQRQEQQRQLMAQSQAVQRMQAEQQSALDAEWEGEMAQQGQETAGDEFGGMQLNQQDMGEEEIPVQQPVAPVPPQRQIVQPRTGGVSPESVAPPPVTQEYGQRNVRPSVSQEIPMTALRPQLTTVPNYTGETQTQKATRTPTETWLKERYENPFRQMRAGRLRLERSRGSVDIATQGRESHQNIKNTARQLDAGELDINKLATKHNSLVVHTIPLEGWTKISPKERIDTVAEKRPDLSASIINADTVPNQDLLYPIGLVLDGKLISAYETDSATHAIGDSRIRPEQNTGTLQANPAEQFARIAQSKTPTGSTFEHNESIVHMPEIKAILLDEKKLLDYEGLREITETFPASEEEAVLRRYGDSIVTSVKGTPSSGPYAGQQVFRIKRRESEIKKAVEFAEKNYPHLPVYLRKSDGIYSLDGKKVTAEQIYSTPNPEKEIPDDERKAA